VSQSTRVYNLKSDFSTRRWRQHTWKTGLDVKYNRVQNLSLTSPNGESNGLPGGTRSDYVNFNPEGATYVQDRWEFEGLVLNAGLRYDFFTPGAQIQDVDLKSGKRYKSQFSPRLGIAYPVSDRDVLSFHYGWTYQTPNRSVIFENRGISSTVGVKGNPDLEPETNIAYQAGVQHLFTKDISGQFSVFFKDIYGLITVRQERDDAGNLVNVFYNGDYASARGFEASLIKSFSHKFSTDINYTYSIATGVASDPNTALQFFNGGRLYLPISEQPLDWDQRHTGEHRRARSASPASGACACCGRTAPASRSRPRSATTAGPTRRSRTRAGCPRRARLTLDADKFYKVWGPEPDDLHRRPQRARRDEHPVGQPDRAAARSSTRPGRTTTSISPRPAAPAAPTCQDTNGDNVSTGCRCTIRACSRKGATCDSASTVTF
jgi:hypothetical protein